MPSALDQVKGWTLPEWRSAYGHTDFGLARLRALREDLEREQSGSPAWICIATREQLDDQLVVLERKAAASGRESLPLFGVPFAVKDNIDVAGWETTVACPAFRYAAREDAAVVARLKEAGAIVLGKTNLDQFATGLVGVRSPYGIVPSTFDDRFIGGGSSSGSAFVVARGAVPFSLGTDTAGSGRVPASFNNLVGLKPTRGRFSTRGVVPACRTLDCVSIFALTVDDAARVASVAEGYDELDPYSRHVPEITPRFQTSLRFAVPDQLEFFGDELARTLFEATLARLTALGVELAPLDFSPFRQLAALLYQGPWVAERTLVVSELLERDPAALHPVVRGIIQGGASYSALQAFEAEYARARLARIIQRSLVGFDALVVPTTPTTYRIEEVEADPIATNSRLGTYTNFTNLADLSALALPAGFRSDGLPSGVTLLAPAFHDEALAEFGARFQEHLALPLGATERPFPAHSSDLPKPQRSERDDTSVRVAVVGAHLTGLPLNHELTERGATLAERTHSASNYRLFALPNTKPAKPGLVRSSSGSTIELEVWDMPLSRFGDFVRGIPAPLGIGTVELADGRSVKGFICEPSALEGALDITHFGGFRAYLASLVPSPSQDP